MISFITSWWYFNLRRIIICLFQLTNDKRFARKRITPGLNHLDTGPKLKVNKTSWTSSERLMHAQFTSCDSNFLICFIIWKQCNLIFLKLSKYKQKKWSQNIWHCYRGYQNNYQITKIYNDDSHWPKKISITFNRIVNLSMFYLTLLILSSQTDKKYLLPQ